MNWIKCSDRLPTETKDYLTWNGDYYVEQFVVSSKYWQTDSTELDPVTHWAEINPPEGEE